MEPSPQRSRPEDAAQRARIERFAWLLDDAFRIPGTSRRVGFDALIGLVPGVGDAAGALLSSYILFEGARLGVGVAVLLRMALNIGVETGLGFIPLLGDLFDFVFKANDRNARLIEAYLDDPEHTRHRSRTLLIGTAVALIALLLALIAGALWLLRGLVTALGSA